MLTKVYFSFLCVALTGMALAACGLIIEIASNGDSAIAGVLGLMGLGIFFISAISVMAIQICVTAFDLTI